jgi:D-alanyl-D-alanine carboxypeptidase
MADESPACGLLLGHDGGGPGIVTSVFHAPRLGATACAMCAVEGDALAHRIVEEALAGVAASQPAT